MLNPSKHVLYTVLNWGLGHATRSIPIIKYLISTGIKVSIAGEGTSLQLLKTEFPHLDFYEVRGIDINYPKQLPMSVAMLIKSVSIINAIKKEHLQFIKLAEQIKPDIIISDNRYGAHVQGIYSVILCHQLRIYTSGFLRFADSILYRINRKFLKKFNEVWVPDFAGENNLTGLLSHEEISVKELRPRYIGPLSRLAQSTLSETERQYDILVILSGPEPQRSLLESTLEKQLLQLPFSALMVCGTLSNKNTEQFQNIVKVPHLSAVEMKFHLLNSKYIITRSGHSTLMDLCAVKKSAICIATPGQTEQEYLAKIHSASGRIVSFKQDNIDLAEGIKLLTTCIPFELPVNEGIKAAIDSLLLKGHD